MSIAATADHNNRPTAAADERQPALPFRSDTFLGVCEAIGQDLGFNPNWLRIPFAAMILWNPEVIIAAYLGLGVVVATARWFFPAAQKAPASQPERAESANDAPVAEKSESEKLLAA